MLVYKFKSLQKFEHITDIFLHRRFYAALLSELNDPMEGVAEYESSIKETLKKEFQKSLNEIRVCCFSKKKNNELLWSHYADGCRGICIEVSVSDYADEVRYNDFPLIRRIREDNLEGYNPQGLAEFYCLDKMKCWEYEKEIRLFPIDQSKYIDQCFCEIKAVLFGLRIPDREKADLLKLIPGNIQIFNTKISDSTGRVIKSKRIR